MKEPTIEITYNGMKYYSEVALAENQLKWYNLGKAVGIEEGKKSNGYSSYDIKKLHTDMNHIHHLWYDKGYNAGKREGYKEGYDDASIKYFDEYSVKLNDRYKNEYDDGYNDGYEQCKHDGISKKEIPGEYLAHIEEARLMGYAEGYSDAKEGGHAEGYEDGPQEEPSTNTSGIKESEYDKGYYAGWEDGKNHIMQYI